MSVRGLTCRQLLADIPIFAATRGAGDKRRPSRRAFSIRPLREKTSFLEADKKIIGSMTFLIFAVRNDLDTVTR